MSIVYIKRFGQDFVNVLSYLCNVVSLHSSSKVTMRAVCAGCVFSFRHVDMNNSPAAEYLTDLAF